MNTVFNSFVVALTVVVCGCATMPEPTTPEVAVDNFLREYVGVQFGDDISKINGYEDGIYMIPMKRNFKYFTHAQCVYHKGKMYRINIVADIAKEYSQTSTEEQLKKDLANLAQQFCLPSSYFHHVDTYLAFSTTENKISDMRQEKRKLDGLQMSYIVKYAKVDFFNYRRYLIDLSDPELKKSLDSDKVKAPQYKPVTGATRRNWGLPLPEAE